MKPKTITIAIVSLIIAVVGIFIALFGIYMNATVLTWVGVAITLVFALGGTLFAAAEMAKKSKDK